MTMTRLIEIGWEDELGREYRVTLSVSPGYEGRTTAPEGPEVFVEEVWEDWPGGVKRPDLVQTVADDLDPESIAGQLEDDDPWEPLEDE